MKKGTGVGTDTARPFPPQSPAPEFGEKYCSLSGFPSHSLESAGGAFLTLIFGQIFAYFAFSDNHSSSPGSVSGFMASTGHSHANTAVNAFVRVDHEHVLALVETIHRAHLHAVHGFAANAALIDDVGQSCVLSADRNGELLAVTAKKISFLIRQSFMRMTVVSTPIGFSNVRNCCVRFCVFHLKRCN